MHLIPYFKKQLLLDYMNLFHFLFYSPHVDKLIAAWLNNKLLFKMF